MTIIGWIQILLYCAIVVALVKPLGAYMTHVFNGDRTWLSPVLQPVERAIYWAGGVDETRERQVRAAIRLALIALRTNGSTTL